MKINNDLIAFAREAVNVQDACNMGGVATSFARAVQKVWGFAHEEGHGTNWVNSHPIVQLYVSKMLSLSEGGISNITTFRKSYGWCMDVAENTSNNLKDYEVEQQ